MADDGEDSMLEAPKALLGLAEFFRNHNPPYIMMSIKCLLAVLKFNNSPKIDAVCHYQLGTIVHKHTKNIDYAQIHLEKAWALSSDIPSFDHVKYDTVSLLSQIYEKQNRSCDAKPLLRKAIEISQDSPFWHCSLLFQLAQLTAREKDFASSCSLLAVGAEYAASKQAENCRILFSLSQAMIMLINRQFPELIELLQSINLQIDQYVGASIAQKESLRVFFLVIQVCHQLVNGQVKSVKPVLKQLQQSIQMITSLHTDDEPPPSPNPADMFHWLPREHMCVLVYLVTVMHSMQGGYMDKAQKYTDKALMQIEKLKMLDDSHPLLHSFQLMILEHIIMCRLIMGNKTLAIQEIYRACQLCQHHQGLFNLHSAQIHALLGLYAMSMNCMEAAEAQFKSALKKTEDTDLWVFVGLNLAIVYLRTNRQNDFVQLLRQIEPSDHLISSSYSLRASAFYVKGLRSFFQANYSEAKAFLRETLKMANLEDLNRLTSCSLVLLGHIFLSLGNSQDALNMVTPAMQLASKIPDVHVQLWASALLKDLYRLSGDPTRESEGFALHDNFSQSLLKDHFQSSQQSEHHLIHWVDGPCPLHLYQVPAIL